MNSGTLAESNSRAPAHIVTTTHNGRTLVLGTAGKDLDQALLDEIGAESSDSEDSWDTLPAPSVYSKPVGSTLSRSKSLGCCQVLARDEECFSSVNTPLASPQLPTADLPQLNARPSAHAPQTTLRRSISLSSLQTSRSDYNRAVGDALSSSPKKGCGNIERDLAFMEQLLSEL
jgi:hypothetical protein